MKEQHPCESAMKAALFMDLPMSQREGLLSSLAPRWIDFLQLFCDDFEEVRLCLPLDDDMSDEVVESLGFPGNMRLIGLPYYVGPDRFIKKMPTLVWQGIKASLRQAKECDVIFYNSPSLLGCIFATSALLRRRPQIEFVRGNKLQILPQAFGFPKGWFYYGSTWLFESWMDIIRRLGQVITFTQGSELSEQYEKRNRGSVFSMMMMVSANALRPVDEIEAAAASESSSPVILYVGRLSAEKGVDNLLKAVSILARDNRQFTLRVVGSGQEEANLRKLASNLGIDSSIEWAGRVSHGPELFKEFDSATIFVLPSLSEGSPAAIAEAMARGIPVVASRVGGIPDLVKENETGLLVDAGDSRQLADAILKLMLDSEMRVRFAIKARGEVASHTLQDQYKQMLAIFRERFALTAKTGSSSGDVEVTE